MPELIVSDTSPLVSLEKIKNGFNFIRKLYDKIIIPKKVLEEVSYGYCIDTETYLKEFDIKDLVEVKDVCSVVNITGIERLHGEIHAISLALQLNLTLLIEETTGRKVARMTGLKISGIAGHVLKAFKRGIIDKNETINKLNQLYRGGRINKKICDKLINSLM